MKKFLLYAGAVTLSILCFVVISAFKSRSVQDEGGHFIIVKVFQNYNRKSYIMLSDATGKVKTIDYNFELIKNKEEANRAQNLQILCSTLDGVYAQGYHLAGHSSTDNSGAFITDTYIFEK